MLINSLWVTFCAFSVTFQPINTQNPTFRFPPPIFLAEVELGNQRNINIRYEKLD